MTDVEELREQIEALKEKNKVIMDGLKAIQSYLQSRADAAKKEAASKAEKINKEFN